MESKIAMKPRDSGQETQIKSPEEAVARTVNILQKGPLQRRLGFVGKERMSSYPINGPENAQRKRAVSQYVMTSK